jgi:SpoVK/Ycf46/Vps4 family AAA+-type ATPase
MFDDHRFDRQRTVEFMKANVKLVEFVDAVDSEFLGDEQLLLLPNHVHAFVLRSRKWFILDIDKIVPIKRLGGGFESLVLPEGYARLIGSLVETHSSGGDSTIEDEEARNQVDLVRGKGKGRIILLHGAPGVGKTSTAECVADYTQRTLFPITCGDIGETARDVEENLEQNFSLAHRWGCVLLLDEADVFLQARDKEDMRRNSVVSVFLRVLEYYSGILFLTTNKIGDIDEAFKSRIHLPLYYPPLDLESTMKVWKMNIQRTVDKKYIDVESSSIKQYAKQHYKDLFKAKRMTWNGRQIKNAFQTAIALAEYDAKTKCQTRPTLSKEHFEIVAKASEGFDNYLARIHGTDNERARRDGQRDDDPWRRLTSSQTAKRSSKISDSDSSSEDTDAREKRRKKAEKKARKKAEREAKARAESKAKGSDSDTDSS